MVQTSQQMKRPRIYGSDGRCRAALARYLQGAEELVDQADGLGKRIAMTGDPGSIMAFSLELEWERDLRRWFALARRGMSRYLQDGLEEVVPILAAGLPPNSGKPRHRVTLDSGVPWLKDARDELRRLQATLGVRRDIGTAPPASARFDELRASGLLGSEVVDDYAKDMLSPRTPKQLHDAIGAAKEVTEATLRAALDRLGESYRRGDELSALMKKWRTAIGNLAPPDSQGAAALDKAQAALANLVTFLAEWRNIYGRGHGRSQYSPGLSTRHARLAADAADMCVRFIATTMDDLQLLPP